VTVLLESLDDPVARQSLAILHLAGCMPSADAYAIVTDHDTALDYASRAVENAEIPLLRDILAAHAQPLNGAPGAFLLLVTAVSDGDDTRARQLAEAIAQYGSTIQRQAYAIRLRVLARLTPEMTFASELAELIHRDETT
jgi:hypothetical protein